MRTKQNIFYFFFLMVCIPAIASSADFRLEGVLIDARDPEAALAIIDGEPLRRGDVVENYTVTGIASDEVTLKNSETNEEKILKLEEKKQISKTEETSLPQISTETEVEKEKWFVTVWEAPGRTLNRIFEMKALRDLAIVHNASIHYFNQKRMLPPTTEALVSANLLPASYKEGIRKPYQFRVLRAVNPGDFGIHADPIEPGSRLRHFFLGLDGIVRESYGSPANRTSPPHDY